jgi:hypothetical protein
MMNFFFDYFERHFHAVTCEEKSTLLAADGEMLEKKKYE